MTKGQSPEWRQATTELIGSRPSWSPERIAKTVLDGLTTDQVRWIAATWLEEHVRDMRRSKVRAVERESQVVTPEPVTPVVQHRPYVAPSILRRRRERDDRAAVAERERANERNAKIEEALASWRQSITLEVTEELLASSLALTDGTRVTWGTATVENHESRIDMLSKNVAANIDGIKRHQAAINMIESSGAASLGEAAKIAA